ncbi:hypothetical protein Lalb_Chr16g0379841 [Lupinus albus]|uniref:Uncharacterized protein n=1 Tax=Lupinus albus TaxID=3870 RepID=A0A6A4P879_LUPAL|nr:hypothetical protein Lalb_Chr16g0379841 [Lupinus albus]
MHIIILCEIQYNMNDIINQVHYLDTLWREASLICTDYTNLKQLFANMIEALKVIQDICDILY